jgi:two-component system CheB/CheR fusion protein
MIETSRRWWASAGGVQALQSFFEALPGETGMAFVVILHLDPERESQMAELLQAKTSLPVMQVEGRVPMEPDHVYVIPPDRRLEVIDGALSLSEFEEPRGRRTPIDYFFRSLAEKCDQVAAIVLSGGGADGAVGIKDVKASGGLIFAQDPVDAEHESMPRQAIATGVVDEVLPASEMAERLVRIVDQRAQLPDEPAELEDGERTVLRKILARLQSRTNHDFSQYKRSTVMRRIRHRMLVTSHIQINDYLRYLQEHDTEHQALFKELLVGVTSFFRDAASFEALNEEVIPKLFEGKGTGDTVRAWVVGCATGEEAYSLAMLLQEQADTMTRAPKMKVFASDLDGDALATARQGRYPRSIEADVSEARLQRFFEQEGNHYRAKRSLRDRIIFARHSILRDAPFSQLDLLSCRNVLIFMMPELQEQVFKIFHYALRPGGYLFLGQAETAENTDWFRATDRAHHLYQRRERSDGRLIVPSLPQGVTEPSLPPAPDEAEWGQAHGEQAAHTEETLHRHALEDYAPPSALVDDRYHAVHLSERAGRYLEPPGGVPTKDITELARPELQMVVRSALHRAFEDGAPTVAQPVQVQFNGHPRTVHLTVRPSQSPQGEPLALVIFNEGEAVEDVPQPDDAEDPAIRRLENKLKQKQEQLQAVKEQYESSREEFKAQNEELRSMNEEYKSATEELETSKEELQSVNEELQTVNTELENKLDALSRAHGDLQNLVDATEVGILFLDRALQIRRFSPPMTDILNIRDSDQGRPIGDLTHKLRYDALEGDARQVLDDLVPIDKEVQSTEGAWYLMRIRPYRTVEDKIDGVVVTFVDISAQKRTQEALRQAKEYAESIVDTVREGLLVLDTDLRVETANESFYRLFETRPQATEGKLIYEIGGGNGTFPSCACYSKRCCPRTKPSTILRWRTTSTTSASASCC